MNENKYLKSSNPFLDKANQKAAVSATRLGEYIEPMTVSGAINKTLLLTGILMVTTFYSYAMATPFLLWTGAIGGLIVVIYSVFKPEHSPIAAPIYAGLEGLFLGAISAMYASLYSGIVLQAAGLTLGTLVTMLFIYKTGIVTVTQKLRSGVIMATGAVLIVYILSWVMSLFGVHMTVLHDSGPIGIGISLLVIGVASFNLLLDFDNFDKGEENQAPQYMEWFYAMGLIITVVWLYVEFLRLLSKLRD